MLFMQGFVESVDLEALQAQRVKDREVMKEGLININEELTEALDDVSHLVLTSFYLFSFQ
jgi:hypothetical protein